MLRTGGELLFVEPQPSWSPLISYRATESSELVVTPTWYESWVPTTFDSRRSRAGSVRDRRALVDYDEIELQRGQYPAWQLLRWDQASWVLSFLGMVFAGAHASDLPASTLERELDDEL